MNYLFVSYTKIQANILDFASFFLSKTIFMLLYLANGDQLLSLNLILSPLSIITGNKLDRWNTAAIFISIILVLLLPCLCYTG